MLTKSSSSVDFPAVLKRKKNAVETPVSRNSAAVTSYMTMTETTSTTESKSALCKTTSTPSIMAARNANDYRKMSNQNNTPRRRDLFPDIRKQFYTPEHRRVDTNCHSPRIRCLDHIMFDSATIEPSHTPVQMDFEKLMLQSLDPKDCSDQAAENIVEDSFKKLLEESNTPTDASKSIENEDYLEGQDAFNQYYDKYRKLLRLMQKKDRKSPFLVYLDTCERERMIPVPMGLIQRKFSRRDIHLK